MENLIQSLYGHIDKLEVFIKGDDIVIYGGKMEFKRINKFQFAFELQDILLSDGYVVNKLENKTFITKEGHDKVLCGIDYDDYNFSKVDFRYIVAVFQKFKGLQ